MSDFRHRTVMVERVIKAGAINFVRNAWLSVAAIAVMVITLTIVLFSLIASVTFNNSIKQLTDKIDISFYLKDSITSSQREDLTRQLEQLPNTKSVDYVSKEDALANYKKQNQNNLSLLLAISQTDNPLPASLRIKAKDPNKLEDFELFFNKKEVVALQSEKPSYSGERKTAIDNITRSTHFFQQAGIVGVVVFTVVSMLIIFNTIRMAIFNRRDELNIMRLLGASTWYIRGPFIVETVLYGLAAALISVALCQSLFTASSALQASTFGVLDINYANDYFIGNYWLILTGQIAIGIVIGAGSSYFATRRYLKFKTSK